MTVAQTPLHAQCLSKSYAGHMALQDLSLVLRPGELVALLGPNGAGKSTLMQLLTGLFSPDSGHIHIMGNNLQTAAPQALSHLGVVFQQAALDLDLSVKANLLFHTDLHGMPRHLAQARILEGLDLLGLVDHLNQQCRSLSGGNRRKIELVRALLHRPAVLLMDEATVGLDPASRVHILQAVHHLQKQFGVATLWATHLMEEAAQANRVIVLHKGLVRYEGQIADLLTNTSQASLEDAFMHLTRQ